MYGYLNQLKFFAIGMLGLLIFSTPVLAKGDVKDPTIQFKLKPGANGKLCLKCHVAFNEKMSKPVVHTPLRQGVCTGCHTSHSSTNAKLVEGKSGEVCQSCHSKIVLPDAVSVHKVVANGECLKCHDPHSSLYKMNLVMSGKQLCASCHKEFGEQLNTLKFKHKPVLENCLNCHDPHSSAKQKFLLKSDSNTLCAGCHKIDTPLFSKKHMGYPVAKARCTGCHDPHGSNVAGMIYDMVHKPIMSKMCNQCHDEPNSANPLKLKREGNELCQGCHSTMMNMIGDSNRVHWPVLGKKGCLGCHSPHAAKHKGILRVKMTTLCGECHGDSIRRQEKSVSKHEPVMKGECTSCHDPHASNFLFLAKAKYDYELCLKCHDWGKHSAHPIGEKSRDPRNKNLSIGCASCHRSHGTEFKKMFYYPSTTEVCVQCHDQYKR